MKPKIALCLIVKGSDDEAELLFRALDQTYPYVDGIFITLTQENKKVREVAESFGKTKVSFYKWNWNFAAARNYNFEQVPKDFTHILWMDTDDLFRGIENLEEILRKNPDTDVFTMNYLYWFDEHKSPIVVHLKTQVVKNDGCVTWTGVVHEGFAPTREIKAKFIEDIERLHLSNTKRARQAEERNLVIAQREIKERPEDPRSWWLLARAQANLHRDESIESFKKFILVSQSDEEKYLARVGMGQLYFSKKDYSKALDEIRYAIGLKPEYPDAYINAGHIYFEMKDYHKAREYYGTALTKKAPKYSILVYNPRDYDYTPLMGLAKTYFNLQLPTLALDCLKACLAIIPGDKKIRDLIKIMETEAEKFDKVLKHIKKLQKIKDIKKLKKAMEKLPIEVRSHPEICRIHNINFIKKESSGKDLVYFCAYTGEVWTPDTVKEKGIGGSEEAVISLSRELTKKGWNVTVYNNCGSQELEFDGVKYKPFWSWNYRDRQDVVILWRHPQMLSYEINAKKIYVDMHDVLPAGEFTEKRLKKVTKIMVKSRAQRDLYPNVPDHKIRVIPNGIDPSQFDKEIKRDPYLLVNFSSADRSLESALDIFEEVMEKLPVTIRKKVKFAWYYGWQVFDASRTSVRDQQWKKKVMKKFEEMKKQGLVEGGYRINHEQVRDKLLEAGALFYPSEFYEIDFMGGTKAQMAGCVLITTDFAAMDEKIKYGIKVPSKKTKENWTEGIICNFGVKDHKTKKLFVNALVDYLKNPDQWDRTKIAEWAREEYNLDKIVNLWHNELKSQSIIIPK